MSLLLLAVNLRKLNELIITTWRFFYFLFQRYYLEIILLSLSKTLYIKITRSILIYGKAYDPSKTPRILTV